MKRCFVTVVETQWFPWTVFSDFITVPVACHPDSLVLRNACNPYSAVEYLPREGQLIKLMVNYLYLSLISILGFLLCIDLIRRKF